MLVFLFFFLTEVCAFISQERTLREFCVQREGWGWGVSRVDVWIVCVDVSSRSMTEDEGKK